jgi:hypothetical protein
MSKASIIKIISYNLPSVLLTIIFPVGYDILTAGTMKDSVFWDTTLCGSVCCLLHTGFMLGSLFGHEDGGDMFIRNVGRLSPE